MSEPLLAAEHISYVRDGKTILDDVSLQLQERDFLTILGPNGAGKTQLIRILLGELTPTSGTTQRRAKLRIGYMPQDFLPPPSLPLTVRRFLTLNKNVAAAGTPLNSETPALQGVDMDAPLHSLSGGERQRVLLARALIGNPDVLVLDEPAQNLDVAAQESLYQQLNEIYAKQNIAILMISHDLHLVMAASRRVVCLYQHICCSGTPQAVAQDPHFRELFGDKMADIMAVYPHAGHTHAHNVSQNTPPK